MQSTENDTQIADLGALIARAEEYARPEPFLSKITGNYEIVRGLLAALVAERDRADRWSAQLAAVEKVLDDEAFDDEDGNGFVPIGPLQDALFGKKMPG